MALSLVIDTDPDRLAAALGVNSLLVPPTEEPAAAEVLGITRIEPRQTAAVLRLLPGGAPVAEPLKLSPHVVKRQDVRGDMLAESLLGREHGLLVLRSYSEWVSVERLRSFGFPAHELCSVYHRYRDLGSPGPGIAATDRLVLANFAPGSGGALLAPVLIDRDRDEAILVCDSAPEAVAEMGGRIVPTLLGKAAAWQWLDTDATIAVDFEAVLADGSSADEPFSMWLYKTA